MGNRGKGKTLDVAGTCVPCYTNSDCGSGQRCSNYKCQYKHYYTRTCVPPICSPCSVKTTGFLGIVTSCKPYTTWEWRNV